MDCSVHAAQQLLDTMKQPPRLPYIRSPAGRSLEGRACGSASSRQRWSMNSFQQLNHGGSDRLPSGILRDKL